MSNEKLDRNRLSKFIGSTKSFFAEALSGKEYDYTQGKMMRAVWLLSIPMILEMLMESVFAIADIYFVSKISSDAIATVGITESIITIVYAVGMGLSMAAAAIVSRRIGEKKFKDASRASVQAIYAGLFASILIAVPGYIYASDLLIWMEASPNIVENMSTYTALMLGGNVVIVLLFVINGIFRSAGDAMLAMRVLWLANILNLILDPCLIFGWGPFPELGITGAAIATNIGRGIAVIYQLYLLAKGRGRINISPKMLKLNIALILKIFKLSLGTIGQFLIATLSWTFMVKIIGRYGSDVVAGYTIGLRIAIFTFLPTMGFGNAAATLVGQNLGAGKPERAEQSIWLTSKLSVGFLLLAGVFYVLFPDFWVSLLTEDAAVIAAGADCLRLLSYGFPAYAIGAIVVNAINGAGDTFTPTIVNLIAYWALEIPLALGFAIWLGLSYQGVIYAIIIAEVSMTLMSIRVIKRGAWKEKMV